MTDPSFYRDSFSPFIKTKSTIKKSRDQLYSVVIITFKIKISYEKLLQSYKQKFSCQIQMTNNFSKKKYFVLNGPCGFMIEPLPEASISTQHSSLFVANEIGMFQSI